MADDIELVDEPEEGSGWEFRQNFEEWPHEDFIGWLDFIDGEQELSDEYTWKDRTGEDIAGKHFNRQQLGNAQWCRDNIRLSPALSDRFAAIVRVRITNYENIQNNNNEEDNNEEHVGLDQIAVNVDNPLNVDNGFVLVNNNNNNNHQQNNNNNQQQQQQAQPAQQQQVHQLNSPNNINVPIRKRVNLSPQQSPQPGVLQHTPSPGNSPRGPPLNQSQFTYPNNSSHQQSHNDDEKKQSELVEIQYDKKGTLGGPLISHYNNTSDNNGEPKGSYLNALDQLPSMPDSSNAQNNNALDQVQNMVLRAISSPPQNRQPVKAVGNAPQWHNGGNINSQSVGPAYSANIQQNYDQYAQPQYAAPPQVVHVDPAQYGPPPALPFESHPPPSMKKMSNKFRQKGPNKIMYPPKNGPIAVAKRLKIPINEIPAFDPHDEITGDPLFLQNVTLKYAQELSQLQLMGYTDQNRNLRTLLRLGNLDKVIDEYLRPAMFEGIFIGDRVVRGPDWKWGDQDGGPSLEGTVRGLRQWHPTDPPHITTEVIVLWDHGYYGNYRFGYKSAFDVKVIDRYTDEKQQDQMIQVGQRVTRKQTNWRWGQQDGGPNCVGTVIELYASPAPFEGGARVGVLWDHQKAHYRQLAEQYKLKHPQGDDEWYIDDDMKDDQPMNNGLYQNPDEVILKFKNFKLNPHQVRKKRKKYKPKVNNPLLNDQESDEDSSEWDEPDFEEVLSKPIPKYRWSLSDPKSDFGVAQDLEISESKNLAERRYLMIDDRVRRSHYFKARRREPKSEHGIVLKVEQADPRRVNADQIKGDRVFTTWSSHQSYLFQSDDGVDDIIFYKRGQVFQDKWSRIKVGDRVRRGITWRNSYGMEDGGHESKGTVVCVQYVLQIAGILAKVRWDRTQHINFYSWGFKDIFDLKKSAPGL